MKQTLVTFALVANILGMMWLLIQQVNLRRQVRSLQAEREAQVMSGEGSEATEASERRSLRDASVAVLSTPGRERAFSATPPGVQASLAA